MGKRSTRSAVHVRAICWGLLATGLAGAPVRASPRAAVALLADGGAPGRAAPADPVPKVAPAPTTVAAARPGPARADFAHAHASQQARHVAHWVVDSGDNAHKPFVIVDKREARVFVFDARGTLRGASSALLGLAIGDHSTPGIGDKKLSDIRPEERTTPAGRFVANLDKDLQGRAMLWVDYDTAISLHPVVAGHPRERRAQRLASSSSAERRISYGCINTPASFFEQVVRPAFADTDGIVYVLPDIQSVRDVFGSYDVGDDVDPQRTRE